ncbi:hypothetical protein B0H17DRAFT_1133171 [Mycena rosella]|uniref:Uncharacterized protein n=1 Tax=Mycena rosella TaxID=1033263 RepID=A0AAD7DJ38_MYCRO|nr:hypothetical protein B0H17DRAFT_1133171 [Mycena rosella]
MHLQREITRPANQLKHFSLGFRGIVVKTRLVLYLTPDRVRPTTGSSRHFTTLTSNPPSIADQAAAIWTSFPSLWLDNVLHWLQKNAEAERAQKKEEVDTEKQRKATERERKQEEKATAAAAPKKRGTKRKRTEDTGLENDQKTPPVPLPYTPDTPPAQKRPRPAYHVALAAPVPDPAALEAPIARAFGE